MPTDQSFADHVCEQIRHAGKITFKKMFGEYAVYCDEKVVGLICDNQFFLKPTDAGRKLLPEVTMGEPYPGAKPYFLMDAELDQPQRIQQLVRVTAAELPLAKPKKKRGSTLKAAPRKSKISSVPKKSTKKAKPKTRKPSSKSRGKL